MSDSQRKRKLSRRSRERENMPRRRLELQRLEDRRPLAVTAAIEGDTLAIRGDDASEFVWVDVAQTGITIRGSDMATRNIDLAELDTVTKVNVGMGAGNDLVQLVVRETEYRDRLFETLDHMSFNAWSGGGNDRVMVDIRSEVVDEVFVDGGDDFDRVSMLSWEPREFSTFAVEQTNRDALAAAQVQLRTDGVPTFYNRLATIPITSSPDGRSYQLYADAIDQFDVRYSNGHRYIAGGSGNDDTRCNIFAGDVMDAMNAPLPSKDEVGGNNGGGSMTAGAGQLHEWLNDERAAASGWVTLDLSTQAGRDQLMDHVLAGKPALASATGHIAVIRPDQAIARLTAENIGELQVAQAGRTNSSRIHVMDGFGTLDGVTFHIHA